MDSEIWFRAVVLMMVGLIGVRTFRDDRFFAGFYFLGFVVGFAMMAVQVVNLVIAGLRQIL